MCGPEEMIFNVKDVLQTLGVSEDKIKFELFTTPVLLAAEKEVEVSNFTGTAKVKVIYDEEETEFELASSGRERIRSCNEKRCRCSIFL